MVESWIQPVVAEADKVEQYICNLLKNNNPELEEMCLYVATSGGKRIRPLICILSHLACGGNNIDRAISIGSAFEIFHAGSLIHDDINDDGLIRRGRKALHREYTITKAIIAGDFMMVKGIQALGQMPKDIMDFLVETASCMSASEFIQKDHEHDIDVTVNDYFDIINGKTAMLIKASAKTGAHIATDDINKINAIADYSEHIGLAFQIVDDVLDVIGCSRDTGKKTGLDIMEGKPTLPLIYAMHNPDIGDRIKTIFSKKEPTYEDVDFVIDSIKKTDVIQKCMDKADQLKNKGIEALAILPDSQYKESLIGLANYITCRDR